MLFFNFYFRNPNKYKIFGGGARKLDSIQLCLFDESFSFSMQYRLVTDG